MTDAPAVEITLPSALGPQGPAGTVTSASGQAVNLRTALAAIASPVADQLAILTEDGRQGPFKWKTGNYTSRVANDPAQIAYVAHATIPTSTGCWVRDVWNHEYCPDKWAGVKRDVIYHTTGVLSGTGLTDASAAFTSADVGKVIQIQYAGTSGTKAHTTTIAAFNSATSVTLAVAAPTAIASGALYAYGTDDTAAWQALINFVAFLGGGTIIGGGGSSFVNGALQDTSNSNSQLLLPRPASVMLSVAICFMSFVVPDMQGFNTGSILYSTLTAGPVPGSLDSGGGAIIGGSIGASPLQITVSFENFCFRQQQNPQLMAVNARQLQAITWRGWCRIDVANVYQGGVLTVQQPTNLNLPGIAGPINNIPLLSKWENVAVIGYAVGIYFGELNEIGSCQASCCIWGFGFHSALHPSTFQKLQTLSCLNQVFINGACHLTGNIDIEHSNVTAGTSWFVPRGTDLWDATNVGEGDITVHMHESATTLVVVGGTKIKWNKVLKTNDYTAARAEIFTGFSALISQTSLIEIWPQEFGGTPWVSLVGLQASTALGTVGVMSFSNTAPGVGSEHRVGQIAVVTDGTVDTGRMDFGVGVAGVMTNRLAMTQYGFGPSTKGSHLTQPGGSNGDLAGAVALSAATTATKTFTTAFNSAPVVNLTPQFDVGAGVRYWAVPSTTGFTVNTSSAVTGSFSYEVMGNPN